MIHSPHIFFSHKWLFSGIFILQFENEKKWKQEGRDTRSNLKSVNMATATYESTIRKEQVRIGRLILMGYSQESSYRYSHHLLAVCNRFISLFLSPKPI